MLAELFIGCVEKKLHLVSNTKFGAKSVELVDVLLVSPRHASDNAKVNWDLELLLSMGNSTHNSVNTFCRDRTPHGEHVICSSHGTGLHKRNALNWKGQLQDAYIRDSPILESAHVVFAKCCNEDFRQGDYSLYLFERFLHDVVIGRRDKFWRCHVVKRDDDFFISRSKCSDGIKHWIPDTPVKQNNVCVFQDGVSKEVFCRTNDHAITWNRTINERGKYSYFFNTRKFGNKSRMICGSRRNCVVWYACSGYYGYAH